MRSTVPCPVCTHTLTVIANPRTLGCPFCRATIPNTNGHIPVGQKVRCRRCRGVFTAEKPPPEIRIFASIPEPCPVCQVVLAVRKDLPPGKKVKCGQCGTKFIPTRDVEELLGQPNEPLAQPAAALPEPLPEVPKPASKTYLAPRKPVSKTRLGLRQNATRSSITHLAIEPLEEMTPKEPIQPVAEDEIDLLSRDLGVDLEIPPEKDARPNSKPSPELPTPVRVNDRRLSPDQADEGAGIPAQRLDHAAPAKPPFRPAKLPENGASKPAAEPRRRPDGIVGKRKRRRPVRPATAIIQITKPVEVAPGDVEVVEDEPILEQPAGQIDLPPPDASKPLSYQSAEREAASALLEDVPDEPEELEPDAAMPEGAQQLAQAQSMPRPNVAPAFIARPLPSVARPPQPTGEPWITIDGTKAAKYAATIFVVAALVFGTYYLIIRRGPGRLTVYPTDGVVILDGGDTKNLKVTLLPLDPRKKYRYAPSAKVGEDGKFKLTTYVPDDGAPAGTYKVLIERRMDMEELKELQKTKTDEQIAEISREIEAHPVNSLLCAEVRTTELTAEIVAGKENHLEFKLK